MTEGVTIQLVGMGGDVLQETQTASDGTYAFAAAPGTYAVREIVPDGYIQSEPAISDGGFYTVTVSSGQTLEGLNFGNYKFTYIEGYVYYTDDPLNPKAVSRDYVQGRTPAVGIPVAGVRTGPAPLKTVDGKTQIVNPAGSSFNVETDENGYFFADGLLPGLYTIGVTPPEFATVVTPNPLEEVLVSGGEVILEFVLFYDEHLAPEVATGSISGSVFGDANGSGSWSYPTESGLLGRSVSLSGMSARGATITSSTTTDNMGRYSFTELPEGVYTISVASAPGASISAPLSAAHTVRLGEGEFLGGFASGGPGGAGWLSSAPTEEDVAFATLTLALDTNLDGVADTRVDVSGLAVVSLGGTTGQTMRPLTLSSLAMYGLDGNGDPVVTTTPGLIAGSGHIEGSGSLVDKDLESGLQLTLGGVSMLGETPLTFTGSADRWPIRYSPSIFSAAGSEPINLRDQIGTVVARVLYAELMPMYGVDFAAENADFGDAPASYGTLRATPSDPFTLTASGITYPMDGARHLLPFSGSASPLLGAATTADANGKPTAGADGDSDEGVDLPSAVAPGTSFALDLTVTGQGLLSAWADWNRDGMFSPTERVLTDVGVSADQEMAVAFTVPTGVSNGPVVVRFRITTEAGIGATGMAGDGEVEDYILAVDASMAGGGGGLPTSDEDGNGDLPSVFALGQNYPNPFNPTTVIPYELATAGQVRLSVFDVTGRQVALLVNAEQSAGRRQVSFNAAGLPSGVYMVRLEAGGQIMTKKLTLLK
jgi:hypothetical protein